MACALVQIAYAEHLWEQTRAFISAQTTLPDTTQKRLLHQAQAEYILNMTAVNTDACAKPFIEAYNAYLDALLLTPKTAPLAFTRVQSLAADAQILMGRIKDEVKQLSPPIPDNVSMETIQTSLAQGRDAVLAKLAPSNDSPVDPLAQYTTTAKTALYRVAIESIYTAFVSSLEAMQAGASTQQEQIKHTIKALNALSLQGTPPDFILLWNRQNDLVSQTQTAAPEQQATITQDLTRVQNDLQNFFFKYGIDSAKVTADFIAATEQLPQTLTMDKRRQELKKIRNHFLKNQ